MVHTLTHGIDLDSWYIHGLKVYTWAHGIDMDLWYERTHCVLHKCLTHLYITMENGWDPLRKQFYLE